MNVFKHHFAVMRAKQTFSVRNWVFKKRPYKRYHVELWSMVAEEAGLVEWGPWEGQSVEPPWQQRQATGASAGRWCSHWAMSGGSPALRCQEIHGWGRGRDEGNPGWELDDEASSRLLGRKEKYLSGNFFCKIDFNKIKFTQMLEKNSRRKGFPDIKIALQMRKLWAWVAPELFRLIFWTRRWFHSREGW